MAETGASQTHGQEKSVPNDDLDLPASPIAETIPAALENLLIAIDQSRFLMEQIHSSKSSSSWVPQQHKSLMSARELRQLDQSIEGFLHDLEEQVSREFEALERDNEHEPANISEREEASEIYPIADEILTVIGNILFQRVWVETARKHFIKYSDSPMKMEYIIGRARLGPAGTIESTLGASLIPMVVSRMEQFLGALVRAGLICYPKSLGELPSIPDEIYQRYGTNIVSDDIRRWQYDQKVTSFIKGSPGDWRKAILQWTKVDIASIGADWDKLIEMIQRRHAIVHNAGYVDADYLHNVPTSLTRGLYVGSSLVTDLTYIEPLLVEIETWAICLSVRWGKHFFKDEAVYHYMTLSRIGYFEEHGRWTQALAVVDSVLLDPLPTEYDLAIVARINRWFCLQEIGKDDEGLRREIGSLSTTVPVQHEVTRDLIMISKYALLRDYDALLRAITDATQRTGMWRWSKILLKSQPLIQRAMRESPQIKAFLLGGGGPSRTTPRQRKRGKKASHR